MEAATVNEAAIAQHAALSAANAAAVAGARLSSEAQRICTEAEYFTNAAAEASREIQTAAAEADAKLEEARTICSLAHHRRLQAEQALSSGSWEVNGHARDGQAVAMRLRSHGGLRRKRGGIGGCALRVQKRRELGVEKRRGRRGGTGGCEGG